MTTLMNQLQARIETAVNKTGTYNEALQNLANLYGVPQGETGSRLIPVVQVFDPTINNATAAQNYLLYNSTIVSGGVPSLGMDFTSGTLDPRITFSRASNATLVNSAGLVAYAPHNLLTNSESFEAAAWTKAQSSVTANATVAPDGTTTADLWTPTTTGQVNNTRLVTTIGSATIGVPYSVSVYVKASGKRWAYLAAPAALTSVHNCWFDLQNGVVGTQGSGVTSASIVSVGNGWYRLSTSSIAESTNNYLLLSTPDENGSVNVTADGTGLFIWGAQLNQGPLQPYYFTTPKNLLGYTQEFDNAAWTKTNSSITANSVVSPDGMNNADTLTSAAATAFTFVLQSVTATAASHTWSIYAKNNGAQYLQLLWQTPINGTDYANFDISSGSITGGVNTSASITSVGNGWYRCTITSTLSAASGAVYAALISTPTASRGASFVGDGVKGLYLYGAQLSNSASLDPYVYNPGAAPTSAAYYGPRFDYDPVTLAPKGLLIEEQRTNLLTYSEDFSNAAWNVNWGGGRSISTNVSTAPDGTLSVDSFTAISGASGVGQAISVTAGVTYSFSVWIKTTNANLLARTVSDGGIGTDPKGITVTNTNGLLVRSTLTWTESVTGTRYVGVSCSPSGSAEIWGAQLEAGSFATSYIPTVASQVTRSADNASMIGDNFANWYNATEGSFFAEFQTLFSSAADISRGLLGGDASSSKRYFYISQASDYISSFDGTVVASTSADITGPIAKACSAYNATNKFICSQGGAVQTTTVAAGYPATTSIQIGVYGASTNIFCGHIRRIMYYNTRLTNAQLQALTS